MLYNGSKYADHRMAWVGKNPGTPGFIAVSDAAAVLVAGIQASRVYLVLQNIGADPVNLCLGETAVTPAAGAAAQLVLAAGQTIIFDRTMPWPSLITAICNAGELTDITVNDVIQVISDNPGRGRQVVNEPLTEYGE